MNESTRKIALSKGLFATVDASDFLQLSKWKWYANNIGHKTYACRTVKKGGRQTLYMHKEIIGTPVGLVTDHINGNGLDNRRSNLRVCSRRENLLNRGEQTNNSSGISGVSFEKKSQKWESYLHHYGKKISLGRYSEKEEAVKARTEGIKKWYNDFAYVQT